MPNRKTLLVILALCTCLGLSLAQGAEKPRDEKIRVLLITGGHDYEEKQFHAAFDAIPDVTTVTATLPEAAAQLTPELADKIDVIVFYDMWVAGFSPKQQQAFVALLNRGIGVLALHHTLAAHQEWPEYAKIIGGKYQTQQRVVDGQPIPGSTYDHDQDVRVHIADPEHPITRGLKDFQIHDETYKFFDTDPDAHVLLTTDHPKSDPELAWTKQYGNSRVVYLQLGHDHLAYENPNFRTLLARSIRWTAGRVADPQAPAQKLFNGQDLTGWEAEGQALWEVKDGLLIGRQGPGNTPGDLFTTDSFADFELTVTYRVVWPANSGVWYRYQSGEKTFQADILEYQNPFALSGSLYRPGGSEGPFAAVNTDASIIDREGWNTMVIRAVGNRQQIILNGKQVVDVRADVSDQGRIGFQVHPGDEFGPMQIIVRDVVIRPI
ncbi:MAG: ThuA domain-containing protein [Pirellulaceae bacterium]